MRNGDLQAASLNDDGLDDVFVFLSRSRDEITGLLLLSEP
jgi:hypothetical protein